MSDQVLPPHHTRRISLAQHAITLGLSLVLCACINPAATVWIVATFTTADGRTIDMAFSNPSLPDVTLAKCQATLPRATPGIVAAARTREPQKIGAAKLTKIQCVASAGDPLATKVPKPPFMERAWDWIRANNSWLIGLGSIVVAMFGWRFGRSMLRARRGSTAIAGAVSESHVQSLSVGTGSTVQQAQQITTIHQGLTVHEAQAVALQTFDANFLRLAGAAAEIAQTRVIEFTRSLFARLEQTNPEAVDKARDPGFVQAVFEAQKQYATSGDADLQAMLVELLTELATAPDRSVLQISLKEAIDRAGKLNRTHLDLLALVFVLTCVRWEHFYRNSDIARFGAECIEPFLVSGVAGYNNFSHLASIGCVELGPAPREIEVFIMSHWRTLLSKGIPREKAARLDDSSTGFWKMFEAYDGSDAILRLSAQTNEGIEARARQLGISDEKRRQIIQLDAEFLMKGTERSAFIQGLHPAFERLWSAWKAPNAPLPRAYLTTLGMTLAHSHLVSRGKAPGPLSVWLH